MNPFTGRPSERTPSEPPEYHAPEQDGKDTVKYWLAEMADIAEKQGMDDDKINAVCDCFTKLLEACKAFEGYYDGANDSATRGMGEAYSLAIAAIKKAEQ